MAEQYVHTLIACDPEFAPIPEQVVTFFEGLVNIGASPTSAKLIVMKPSGRFRFFTDPLTGKKKSFSANDHVVLESAADLASMIQSLPQYCVSLDGQGPPRRPPFALYYNGARFEGEYGFTVRCKVRREPTCTSDLADDDRGVLPKFGEACSPLADVGRFRNPASGALIEVAGAGCARLWVEFEFGKWLLPKIEDSLNILDPAIDELASRAFGTKFAQGLHLL